MEEIIKRNNNVLKDKENTEDLLETAENMLLDVQSIKDSNLVRTMPIASLAELGGGVASLLPTFRTITETVDFDTEGLYGLANKCSGDNLKMARDGTYWGAFKTAGGKSKFAKLQEVGPLSANTVTTMPVDPTTMMMAVALYSIENKLSDIVEMQKQILSFLEIEKESEIEADVQVLTNLICNYKSNWDNELFVMNHHKLVIDIKKTSLKHMCSYRKNIQDAFSKKKIIVDKNKVKSILNDLERKFKYYRMSLYTYSLASLLEIMLSGNFKENYILNIKKEVEEYAKEYRMIFDEASKYLEKMGFSALDTVLLGGVGIASKKVGDLIGAIPVVNKGPIDEFLQEGGKKLENRAFDQKLKFAHDFATLGNPQTGMLVEKMEDLIDIYNHTNTICFDKENIYCLA